MIKIESPEGVVLAFLNNLTDAKVHEVLNGEYTLSFVATVDHLKTDYLYDESNLINYNDDLFRVVILEELHDEDNMLTVAVECEHLSYDLIKNAMENFNYTYKTATEVMINCLAGTDFTLRSCDVIRKTDIQYTEECNSKQISIAIANNWRGELRYYRRYIDLFQRRGANRGAGFIFGKNLKTVKRIINRADKTTSYEVEVVEGSELEEFGYFELGDTVRIMDHRLNVDVETKVIEIEKDILTGLNSTVVLGDAIKDMRSSFTDKFGKLEEKIESETGKLNDNLSSTQKELGNLGAVIDHLNDTIEVNAPNWDKIGEITNDLGNVISSKLQGDISLAANSILNSTGTFEQRDNGLYWQDQPTKAKSTFATFWGAQGIMFARSKNSNGDWRWESALNADGLVATKVVASALIGLTISAVKITGSDIIGGLIQGCTMKGGELLIGSNVPNASSSVGDFTGAIIDSSGVLRGYCSGMESYKLHHSHSGKLTLSDGVRGRSIWLDSSEVALSGNDTVTIRLGIPKYNASGVLINPRIEITRDGINLIAFNSSGTDTTKVKVSGDLIVSGDVTCYKLNEQSKSS